MTNGGVADTYVTVFITDKTKGARGATAFIIDPRGRTLLLWHRRLKRWMPPGGHVAEDETPEETARRECLEETGLDVSIEGEACTDHFVGNREEGGMLAKQFDFLLENIPECPERYEPAHQHMDFIYIARPKNEKQTVKLAKEEGKEIRWFTRAEVEALDEEKEIFSNVKAYILTLLPS